MANSRKRASVNDSFERFAQSLRENEGEKTSGVKPKQSARHAQPASEASHTESARRGGPPPVLLPTSQVAIWPMANRIVFDPEAQQALEASILKHGQKQPALVRPIPEDDERRQDGLRYELIYGARRLRAVVNLSQDLLARVINVDDRAAVLEMDIENRERRDISVYERAVDYARWLERGLFTDAQEIAAHVGRNATGIYRYLTIARLPVSVLDAFPDPIAGLSFTFGYDLAAAMEKMDGAKEALDRVARSLAEIEPDQLSIEQRRQRLMAAVTPGASDKESAGQAFRAIPPRPLKGRSGVNLGRVSVSPKGQVKLQTVAFADPDKAARFAEAIAEQAARMFEDQE